jgi:phage baseplate assembly protein W
MNVIFDPSVPVGNDRPWIDAEAALATRVRMVLETQPGTLPWRPDFGCDLAELVGYPATSQLLSQAEWRIQAALRKWIPDATLDRVQVKIVPATNTSQMTRHASVPIAEAALLTLGVQAALHVDIELTGPRGPVGLSATITP